MLSTTSPMPITGLKSACERGGSCTSQIILLLSTKFSPYNQFPFSNSIFYSKIVHLLELNTYPTTSYPLPNFPSPGKSVIHSHCRSSITWKLSRTSSGNKRGTIGNVRRGCESFSVPKTSNTKPRTSLSNTTIPPTSSSSCKRCKCP